MAGAGASGGEATSAAAALRHRQLLRGPCGQEACAGCCSGGGRQRWPMVRIGVFPPEKGCLADFVRSILGAFG